MRAIAVSAFASALAHAGLGITLIGVAATTLWRSEALDVLAPGETMHDRRLHSALRRRAESSTARTIRPHTRDHRRDRDGRDDRRDDAGEAHLSGRRPGDVQTAIRTTGFSDLYLALGDDRGGGRWTIRAYVNPLAPFIWLGGALMALGGLASLWGRLRARLRAHAAAALAPAE